jgi:hypothetical protein
MENKNQCIQVGQKAPDFTAEVYQDVLSIFCES